MPLGAIAIGTVVMTIFAKSSRAQDPEPEGLPSGVRSFSRSKYLKSTYIHRL